MGNPFEKGPPQARQGMMEGRASLTPEEEQEILEKGGKEALKEARKRMEVATERMRTEREEAADREAKVEEAARSKEATPGAFTTQAEEKAIEEASKKAKEAAGEKPEE